MYPGNMFLKITCMLRKTKSRLGQEHPKKEVEPNAPTRKLSHEQNIYCIGVPLQVKNKLEEECSAVSIPPILCKQGVCEEPTSVWSSSTRGKTEIKHNFGFKRVSCAKNRE